MQILRWLTAVLVLGAGMRLAHAQDESDSYCTFVKSSATSQAALLFSPQLYLTVGYINGDDNATGSVTAAQTRTRLTAGLRFSVSETWQGAVVKARADAECERYRALTQLTALTELGREQVSQRALMAKLAVLEEAMPRAAELLRIAQQHHQDGRSTTELLTATQLRVDALRATLAETRQSLAVAATSAFTGTPRSIPALQKMRDTAETALERSEGSFRRAQAWDLVLRGGYDRIFDVRDQLPLFGIATISLKPGWFGQFAADRRAREARLAWSRQQSVGIDARAEVVLRQYRAIEDSEQQRLRESAALLADLETRWQSVESMEGPRAQAFRDYLWFDLIRTRAEVAYLRAHLAELKSYRGDGS